MKLAFYAPLKPADHPTPSGDRAMARALLSALADGGHSVTIASDLRSFEPQGDAATQARLITQANHEITRLIDLGRAEGWAAWFTYHNYYKAPDLIGPKVCAALNIPYLLAEATRAKKRLGGPWDRFAKAAEAACDAACAIFYLTHRDAEALRRDAPNGQDLIHLHPFLDQTELPPPSNQTRGLLSVGMMRHGDKLASYELIAQTLALLPQYMRQIDIVGDGAARPQVEALMAPFGASVALHGALDAAGVARLYAQSKLLLWPGVNEAFGLVYLEAQAAGLPVVAQHRPGACDVTCGQQPAIDEGAKGMAQAIMTLMNNDTRQTSALAARAFIQDNHLRGAATRQLSATLSAVIQRAS